MTQDSTTSEEKSSRSYWGFVLWPVVLVMVYVLSAGPAWRAADKGIISFNALNVYGPLNTLLRSHAYGKPFRLYLHLWVPNAFDKHGEMVERYFRAS